MIPALLLSLVCPLSALHSATCLLYAFQCKYPNETQQVSLSSILQCSHYQCLGELLQCCQLRSQTCKCSQICFQDVSSPIDLSRTSHVLKVKLVYKCLQGGGLKKQICLGTVSPHESNHLTQKGSRKRSLKVKIADPALKKIKIRPSAIDTMGLLMIWLSLLRSDTLDSSTVMALSKNERPVI